MLKAVKRSLGVDSSSTKKEAKPLKLKPAVKIDWLKEANYLSQIYSSGLEYCFISKDDKQCVPFVLCKDFLQDALMAIHHGSAASIYGFSYDPATCEPIYLDRVKIALGNSQDKDFSEKIPHMLDFLHQIEKKLKLIRTSAHLVSNPPSKYKSGVFLIESSNRWMISPPMLSLYSLLIRVGFTHKTGDSYKDTIKNIVSGTTSPYQSNDATYMKSAEVGLDRIIKDGYARIFYKDPKKNYPKVNVGTMHNSMGIVSFSDGTQEGMTEKAVKHWHRKLSDKTKEDTGSKKNNTKETSKTGSNA